MEPKQPNEPDPRAGDPEHRRGGAHHRDVGRDHRALPETLAVDPDEEPSRRERLATLIERRLDLPMAVIGIVWAGVVAYELFAPRHQLDELRLVGNVAWAVFVAELLVRLAVSGRPVRYAVRHWFSVLILLLPALRLLRAAQALRIVRVLPAARVVGSSYRAVGTATTLLQGRLGLLVTVSFIVAFGGGQLLYVLERTQPDGVASFGEALYWAISLAITNTRVFEPLTVPGRVLTLLLGTYSVVVVGAVAATLGAYFLEARAEEAAREHG